MVKMLTLIEDFDFRNCHVEIEKFVIHPLIWIFENEEMICYHLFKILNIEFEITKKKKKNLHYFYYFHCFSGSDHSGFSDHSECHQEIDILWRAELGVPVFSTPLIADITG